MEIVDSIKTLDVSGGETFLYCDLIPFLNELKKYSRIFSINLVTNGTIVPDDAVFEAMKNSNIVLKISDYGEVSKIYLNLRKNVRKKIFRALCRVVAGLTYRPIKV